MKIADRTKRSTLRDVARHADVSVATVSRVLNKSPQVSKETKDRVDKAIEALRFVPSAAARSLNSGSSRTIGALVPTLDHSIFAKYLNALEHRLSEQGYALVVAATEGIPEIEEQKAFRLLDMGVDGLIVSGKVHTEGFDRLVSRFNVPTLITSFFDPEARYPTIGYDNAAIASMAVDYLRELGHRSLAVVHGPAAVNDRIAVRAEAIRRSAKDLAVTFFPVAMTVPGGADAVRAMLETGPLPSAILCLSDVQALGALFELQRKSLAVPEDVSLMGFDDLEWSSVTAPGLTSIHLPAREMGESAADAIIRWISTGKDATPCSLPAHIVARASTRRVD